MNCNKAKLEIGAALDGELELKKQRALDRHLLSCKPCREAKASMLSLSSVLKLTPAPLPPPELRSRIRKSFKDRCPAEQAVPQRFAFGAFFIPKPAFAALLLLAVTGFWLSFQIGRISSSTVVREPPAEIFNDIPVKPATETKVETIFIEVPVIKEKTVVRIVRIDRPERSRTKKKGEKPAEQQPDILPIFNSTTTARGISNDVNLKGFQPAAEMNARVIKENHDEK